MHCNMRENVGAQQLTVLELSEVPILLSLIVSSAWTVLAIFITFLKSTAPFQKQFARRPGSTRGINIAEKAMFICKFH